MGYDPANPIPFGYEVKTRWNQWFRINGKPMATADGALYYSAMRLVEQGAHDYPGLKSQHIWAKDILHAGPSADPGWSPLIRSYYMPQMGNQIRIADALRNFITALIVRARSHPADFGVGAQPGQCHVCTDYNIKPANQWSGDMESDTEYDLMDAIGDAEGALRMLNSDAPADKTVSHAVDYIHKVCPGYLGWGVVGPNLIGFAHLRTLMTYE